MVSWLAIVILGLISVFFFSIVLRSENKFLSFMLTCSFLLVLLSVGFGGFLYYQMRAEQVELTEDIMKFKVMLEKTEYELEEARSHNVKGKLVKLEQKRDDLQASIDQTTDERDSLSMATYLEEMFSSE